jgi:hypothetical protein
MCVTLADVADVAEIATAVVAVGAAGVYAFQRFERQRRLEEYLAKERREGAKSDVYNTGARTIIHLMGRLSMTEAQVMEAGFASKKIASIVAADPDTGRANWLMFVSRQLPSN